MTKSTTYRQCILRRHDNFGTIKELVEWVPRELAIVGHAVECCGQVWTIIKVGAASKEPRSAHANKV